MKLTEEQKRLLADFRQVESEQKERWAQILAQGLYHAYLGADVDATWHNPPSSTLEAERKWARGVRGYRAGSGPGHGLTRGKVSVSREEMDLFK